MANQESRAAVIKGVEALAEELAHCTQTTHGIIGDGSIEKVARALVECYNDPRPYNASTLYQFARQFLRCNTPAATPTKPATSNG